MAVTAYAGKGDESRVREAGADSYVSKPISVSRFVLAVEDLAGPSAGDSSGRGNYRRTSPQQRLGPCLSSPRRSSLVRTDMDASLRWHDGFHGTQTNANARR
jgi:DNA-binding NarL/FixJ family response regulator